MPRTVKYFFLGLILLFAVSIFFHSDTAITQDLGRHLTLGKIILTEKKVPATNLFSYTYPDFPFINHHWGSEVIFYLVDKFVGINGLIFLKIATMICAFGILLKFIAKRVDFIPLLISSLFTLEILRERTEIRPEIFAILLFVLFLLILYKAEDKSSIKIWLLPFLQIAWTNLHISFAFGLVVYLLFLFDRLLSRKLRARYFIVGICLLVATFINPFGWKGAIYPLTIFRNYGYSIVENQSPFFLESVMNNPTIFYFKLSVFFFLLTLPFLLSRKYFFETLTVFFMGGLSVFAIRHFPFFALSLFFPLSLGLTFILGKFHFLRKLIKNEFFLAKTIIYLTICGFFIWEIYSLLSNRYYQKSFSPKRSGFGQVVGMEKTIDFFQKNKLSGPIFNNFDIGSYLIYRLYPKERVFVDGRPEGYPSSFFQEIYIPMQENVEAWNNAYAKFRFQAIIFSHTDATPWGRSFLRRIIADQNWQLIYFDDYGVILLHKESLVKINDMVNTEDKIRNRGVALIQQANKPDTLVRLINFFHLVGFADLERLGRIKLKGINNL